MKCLHILPMNKLSGAEKLVLILCKNMKKYNHNQKNVNVTGNIL